MTRRSTYLGLSYLLTFIICMALSACFGTTPPVKYYSLQPMPVTTGKALLPADVAIAVGPVGVPAAFDRPQIVTRDSENNINISDYHRWAGTLHENIAAVLAENLAFRLGSEKVTPFHREAIFNPTHRLVVNINRLDGTLGKTFVLEAAWSFKAKKSKEPLLVKKSIMREPIATEDYESLVAAQNKALAALSEEIADAIRVLASSGELN